MCGISGIVNFTSNTADAYRESIEKMVFSLKHRGPDSHGICFFENGALGHTRLSIIDLVSGSQPMHSAFNERVAITFNGEIYGYKEIKENIGEYSFKTQSDTEVILALYQKHGQHLLEKLPGIFSFAIWDDEKRELICARDRFGEKPFYYAFGKNGEFVFASEIKAVIASGIVVPEIDIESLAHYMQKLYIHPSKTVYKNIFILPPAHRLVLSENGINISRYWELPKINYEIKLSEAVDEFMFLLDSAVKKQLIADVEVGAFLSGGLDSSTIVALASRYNTRIKTISFGFESGVSELPYAKSVSNMYGTEHIELRDMDNDISELLFKMQEIYDEPFADSSNIPTYLICREAKKHLNVVLTGDGGDELLGGYTYWYRSLYDISKKMNSYSFMGRIASLLTGNRNKNIYDIHYKQNRYFRDIEISSLFAQGFSNNRHDLSKHNYNYNNVDDAMRMDVEDYMPGDILVKTDRASMAVGLELRSPFLDVDFASFCLSLPYNFKIDDKHDKLILRESFGNLLPKEIKERPKQGFGAPVIEWFKFKEVAKLKNDFLSDRNKNIYNYVDYRKAERFIKEDNYRTWILLNLSLWLETRK